MTSLSSTFIDPSLFDQLKSKFEDEAKVKQELHTIVDELANSVSFAQGFLMRVHATPRAEYGDFLPKLEDAVSKEMVVLKKLAEYASRFPYYKFNFKWKPHVETLIFTMLMTSWLGGNPSSSPSSFSDSTPTPTTLGRLLTIEDVGTLLAVPVNLKDHDAFHITIEEYLLGLICLVDELSRLAVNAVTLGDFEMAVAVSGFVKDVFSGFQLLNLKNDGLRRRTDGIKYSVKKVEDVVYDLALRGLIPRKGQEVKH